MPKYSEATREEHKSQVATLMVLRPQYGSRKIAEQLANATDNTVALEHHYVADLMREVREARLTRYSRAQRDEVVAQIEDFTHWVLEQQQRLLTDPKASAFVKNLILNSMVDHVHRLFNLKMDAGILERHLGTLTTKEHVFDMMKLLKHFEQGTYVTDDGSENVEGETGPNSPALGDTTSAG